ncbi:SSI family serine proteinase inhibitor [Arthrobacter sp. GCM10027362]|uniref:SSI family serine proteinase inhibitor n=1 Tax=Arthrobacter sp. GCM10027362 TaxID=3273379 RepID=UPI00362A5B0C
MTDAKLKIVLSTQGVTGSTEQTLECVDSRPTDASTVSDPAAACAALAKSGEAVFFALPDPNRACTQQYGGPQKARVTGTLNGKPVDKEFSLTDGCRIAEWQAMQALFGNFGPDV